MPQRWKPIECNPEVLTSLSHSLGLSSSYGFHDVFSLDDPELLQFIPRPVQALVLVYPSTPHDQKTQQGNVIWCKQTIGNACGTMAVLHCLLNSAHLDPSSPFTQTLQELKDADAKGRVEIIEGSEYLKNAHESLAIQGQSTVIGEDEHVTLHYVAWVNKDGKLWQLDGDRDGPVLEQEGVGEDMIHEGIAAIKKYIHGIDGQFSICALAPI